MEGCGVGEVQFRDRNGVSTTANKSVEPEAEFVLRQIRVVVFRFRYGELFFDTEVCEDNGLGVCQSVKACLHFSDSGLSHL